jgi:hypothetical protein
MSQDDDIPRKSALLPRRSKSMGKPIGPIPEAQRGTRPKIKIAKSDKAHYQSKSETMETFISRLRPTIEKFAREKARKPRDVAKRLNFEKIRTACGALWTPRLVYILLYQLFEKTPIKQRAIGRHVVEKAVTTKKKKREVEAELPKTRSRVAKQVTAASRKRAETYQVRQSFSHGRSKPVVVERKKAPTLDQRK